MKITIEFVIFKLVISPGARFYFLTNFFQKGDCQSKTEKKAPIGLFILELVLTNFQKNGILEQRKQKK